MLVFSQNINIISLSILKNKDYTPHIEVSKKLNPGKIINPKQALSRKKKKKMILSKNKRTLNLTLIKI